MSELGEELRDCIQRQKEIFDEELDRREVVQSAARDLDGYEVKDDGSISHEGITEVNMDAYDNETFAEMYVIHNMEPHEFVREVLDAARVIPPEE